MNYKFKVKIVFIVAIVIFVPNPAASQNRDDNSAFNENVSSQEQYADVALDSDYNSVIRGALDKIEHANRSRERKIMISRDKDLEDIGDYGGKIFFQENSVKDSEEKKMGEASMSIEQEGDHGEFKESVPFIDILEVQDMAVRDVIEIISAKSGLTIFTDPDVKGSVTVYLSNIEAEDALRIILEANDLAYYQEIGIIYVITAQRFESKYGYSFIENVCSRMIQLSHSKVSDSIEVLSQIKSPTGKVFGNEETNTIILIDVPPKIDAMLAFIQKIDVILHTKKFRLEFGQAEEVIKKIEEILTKGVGKVAYDGGSNLITVSDTQLKIEEIERIIKKLNQFNRKITVGIKIFQIVLDDEHRNGIDWEAIVSNYQSMNLIRSKKNKAVEETLKIGTVTDEDFVILQEALDTVGEIYTIKEDEILTVVNKQVDVDLRLTHQILSKENLLAEGEQKIEKDSYLLKNQEKIEFFLLPKMVETKKKGMLKVEVFSVSDFSNIELSQINMDGLEKHKKEMFLKRFIKKPFKKVFGFGKSKQATKFRDENESEEGKSGVIVELLSGSTIIVGGLFKNVRVESQRKIPFLGDLPMVGFAFRKQGKKLKKTEVIIFITPKIVSP